MLTFGSSTAKIQSLPNVLIVSWTQLNNPLPPRARRSLADTTKSITSALCPWPGLPGFAHRERES
jgi:hypothetical protein